MSIFAAKVLMSLCQRYLDFSGFSFFFYSKEHDPIHVHVEG